MGGDREGGAVPMRQGGTQLEVMVEVGSCRLQLHRPPAQAVLCVVHAACDGTVRISSDFTQRVINSESSF